MFAATYQKYGGPEVVTVREVPRPEPKEGEVLVRVRATTVTAGDWRLRTADVPRGFGPLLRLGFGIFGPRKQVLGMELAGEVAAVGEGVDRFSVGDRVFAFTGASLGAHAEYCVVKQSGAIVRIPDGLSFEEAVALPFGGSTALYFLRDKGGVKAGERVLVNGASGGVGTAAVQIAKHLGAHVTAVCSGRNAELVRSLGADEVIDYTKQDFREVGAQWDVILDVVGTAPFASVKGVLREGGRLLLVVADLPATLGSALRPRREGRSVLSGTAPERVEDLELLADLAASGAYRAPIEVTVPFERIREAHALVESGHKRGNVVVLA
jgi:NADPH:quinone reductase-like Zn-dependent oxidoreductase